MPTIPATDIDHPPDYINNNDTPCTTWTLTKRLEEEARRQLHKNVASNIEQVLAATPHKAPTIRPPAFHHENYPS